VPPDAKDDKALKAAADLLAWHQVDARTDTRNAVRQGGSSKRPATKDRELIGSPYGIYQKGLPFGSPFCLGRNCLGPGPAVVSSAPVIRGGP